MSKKEEKGFSPSLWDSFSSLRLTIALLIILAITFIFGTVIPQNASPEVYLRAYKLPTYKILKILGFLDMYHAKWFLFLLALLSLNLVACSWAGLSEMDAAKRAADAVRRLIKDVKIPSLPELGVDKKKLKELAPQMAQDAIASGSPGNNPREATKDEIIELYRLAYSQ